MLQTFLSIFFLFIFNHSDDDLGQYFGFDDLEVIKIGNNAGPMYSGDLNGDGLLDVIVVNNKKSRIELLIQRNDGDSTIERQPTRLNEIPEHWRYNKNHLMVAHQVAALALHDVNNDGRTDMVYAGNPNVIVILEQQADATFKKTRTHKIKNLGANFNAFSITNLFGDDSPEIITIVNGDLTLFPLDGNSLGKPFQLNTEDRVLAFEYADYDGNGLDDIVGIIPDSTEPIRLWLINNQDDRRVIGPQHRFQMSPLRDFTSVTLPSKSNALMATIERASRRIVLYELEQDEIKEFGDREVPIEIYPFEGEGKRKHLIADVNRDGLLDLIATNPENNTIVVYLQDATEGIREGVSSPTISDVNSLTISDLDGDNLDELYVLSEEEGILGYSLLSSSSLAFPTPIQIKKGHTPVSVTALSGTEGNNLIVISKEKRDYLIEVIGNDGAVNEIDLGSLSRGPDVILSFDADQDGKTDILLLTRDKPMKMLRATEGGYEIFESTDMGQYGLVRSANGENTETFDIDGDGQEELLIANDNFVRAVRFSTDYDSKNASGWQVVKQINLENGDSELISIVSSGNSFFVSDKENERIISIEVNPNGDWVEGDSLYISGYPLGSMYAGDFTNDSIQDVLMIGDSSYAIIHLAGDRIIMDEKQSWRSHEERRVQHELAIGDVNSDGYSDMASLDAGEQMLEIFSFSDEGKMYYATGFKIFETKIFSGGDPREWEPSQIEIDDFTGDGKDDILLLSHDRLLLYVQ